MKREYADKYAAFEQNHWWFRARRVILRSLLQRQICWRDGESVLEIGVGPGENLYRLYPETVRLTGLEPDEKNSQVARERGAVKVYTGTIEAMPEPVASAHYDVITLFDVLEHIEDDLGALALLKRKLNPGGRLALTVPAYQWLWGQQDVVNLHYRRYTLSELKIKLAGQGFRVTYATYFNTLLFPPIAAFRLLMRLKPNHDAPPRSDFEYNPGPLNELLFRLFASEATLTKYVSLPVGVSLFIAAEVLDTPAQP